MKCDVAHVAARDAVDVALNDPVQFGRKIVLKVTSSVFYRTHYSTMFQLVCSHRHPIHCGHWRA